MPLLVQQLTHHYGSVHALRGVTAQAAHAKITAILGPNAAGKSTLLRCIIGAITPTSGAALIDGRAAHRMSAYHMAQQVAYVPQRSTVSASFTVREVVELGRYALPGNPEAVAQAMARLELTDLADRPYPALSVGQQQRVTLARAIAQLAGPRLAMRGQSQPNAHQRHLILDEPMSAMDLRHVRECARLLRELAEEGITILIALHDLALAARLADDVWLLNDGRLIEAGPVQDVLRIDLLREVYGVQFDWAQRAGGERVLVADA